VKRAKWSHPSSWDGFKVQKCVLSSEFVASSCSTFRWSTARDRETTQPWEEELAGKASSGCGDNVWWWCII